MNPSVRLKDAFKIALAMLITYAIALSQGWGTPFWAGFAVVFCGLTAVGDSLNKGLLRVFGTLFGAVAGLAGDKWSLGFVAETERQVEGHLDEHLEQVPAHDRRTRAILEQMKTDEIAHGKKAMDHGGARLPTPIRAVMKVTAKLMTRSVYRI